MKILNSVMEYENIIATKGKIYFRLSTTNTKLTENIFNEYLSLTPTKFEMRFARGKIPFNTSWGYGIDYKNDIDISVEVDVLLAILYKHSEEILLIKKEYHDIESCLQVVVYLGDQNPCMHFNSKLINFLSATESTLDCDIYNNK